MSRIAKAAFWAASITAIVVFLPFHRAVPGRAKRVVATAQIQAYLTALEAYKKETGDYPSTSQGLDALRTNPGVDGWNGPYIDRDIGPDPWGHAYIYRYLGREGIPSVSVLDSKMK
jgi:general secretion pathway protein G